MIKELIYQRVAKFKRDWKVRWPLVKEDFKAGWPILACLLAMLIVMILSAIWGTP